ncbi:MAG TPA: ABC transporter permease subunit [Candidatus Limnocylindrales bacterium]
MSATSRWLELIAAPFRASWRAGLAWAVVFAFFIVATVAFWPAFKGSAALSDALKVLPAQMLQAFGLQDFASAAGYLRGGLYDVLIPLMLAAAGAMFANSATAAQEDAGRIELYVAQPVTRVAFMTGRAIATLLWIVVLMLVVLISQVVSDALFDLQIGTSQIVATIVLSGLIGVFCAALAIGLAGISARPGLVLGIPLAVALIGYIVSALFPLSDLLAPWVRISPWEWALGGDPLTNAGEAWRYAALIVPSIVFVAIGVLAFNRRDVRAA